MQFGQITDSTIEPIVKFWHKNDGQILNLSKEDNKDNEKDNKHNKYLNHKPPIGCDWLEVLENLPMSSIYIQSCVIYVTINPAMGKQTDIGILVLMFSVIIKVA